MAQAPPHPHAASPQPLPPPETTPGALAAQVSQMETALRQIISVCTFVQRALETRK
jgi:hypothetical protein